MLGLSHDVQDSIAQHGIRNSHLLAIAQARSISLLANNVSAGIEPIKSQEVSAEDQLRMASSVQACVDNAIAKAVRLPQEASTHDIDLALLQAWELGLKGCAVYRSGSKNFVTRSFNSGPA